MLSPEQHRLLQRYHDRKITGKELARALGVSLQTAYSMAHCNGYSHTKGEQWSQAKIDTLLWLNETQAPLADIAKVMERWGWGKINKRTLAVRLTLLRHQGYEVDYRQSRPRALP